MSATRLRGLARANGLRASPTGPGSPVEPESLDSEFYDDVDKLFMAIVMWGRGKSIVGLSIILGEGTDVAYLVNLVHAGDDAGTELERLPDEKNAQRLLVARLLREGRQHALRPAALQVVRGPGTRTRLARGARPFSPFPSSLSDLDPFAQKLDEVRSPGTKLGTRRLLREGTMQASDTHYETLSEGFYEQLHDLHRLATRDKAAARAGRLRRGIDAHGVSLARAFCCRVIEIPDFELFEF